MVNIKTLLKARLNNSFPNLMLKARTKLNTGYEPEADLLKFFCNMNSASVDIGANYGIYSERLSKLSQTVYSFEPVPGLYKNLESAFKNNNNVKLHNFALSCCSGESVIYSPQFTHGWSSLEKNNPMLKELPPGEKLVEYKIYTRTLDSFSLSNISFIKIDVEGHELKAIKGAVETIKNNIPVLQVEIEEKHVKGSVADVIDLVKSYEDYSVYYLHDHKLELFDKKDFSGNNIIKSGEYIYNFIFIHNGSPVLSRLKNAGIM